MGRDYRTNHSAPTQLRAYLNTFICTLDLFFFEVVLSLLVEDVATPWFKLVAEVDPFFPYVLSWKQTNEVYTLYGFILIEDPYAVFCMLIGPNGILNHPNILHAQHILRQNRRMPLRHHELLYTVLMDINHLLRKKLIRDRILIYIFTIRVEIELIDVDMRRVVHIIHVSVD